MDNVRRLLSFVSGYPVEHINYYYNAIQSKFPTKLFDSSTLIFVDTSTLFVYNTGACLISDIQENK